MELKYIDPKDPPSYLLPTLQTQVETNFKTREVNVYPRAGFRGGRGYRGSRGGTSYRGGRGGYVPTDEYFDEGDNFYNDYDYNYDYDYNIGSNYRGNTYRGTSYRGYSSYRGNKYRGGSSYRGTYRGVSQYRGGYHGHRGAYSGNYRGSTGGYNNSLREVGTVGQDKNSSYYKPNTSFRENDDYSYHNDGVFDNLTTTGYNNRNYGRNDSRFGYSSYQYDDRYQNFNNVSNYKGKKY